MTENAWAARLPTARSKADQVYDSLRAAIASGDLRSGERINMDELARSFGVSKIPVREAVKRLESDGLVNTRAHAGAIVASVDRREMRGVFLAREAIEGVVAKLAAESGSERLVPELEEVQAGMRRALAAGDTAGLVELNSRFHRALAGASGYRILGELTEQLLMTVRRYRIVAPQGMTNWQCVVAEHDAIVDALRSGDPDAVEAAARAHVISQAGHEITAEEGPSAAGGRRAAGSRD